MSRGQANAACAKKFRQPKFASGSKRTLISSPIIEMEGEQFVLETPMLGAFRTGQPGPASARSKMTLHQLRSLKGAATDDIRAQYTCHCGPGCRRALLGINVALA
jgi:hypothetical protein